MKEFHSEIQYITSQHNKADEGFNPDKRVEVSERSVNGNFTDEDKAAMERGVKRNRQKITTGLSLSKELFLYSRVKVLTSRSFHRNQRPARKGI